MADLPARISAKSRIVSQLRRELYTLPTTEQATGYVGILLRSYPAGGKGSTAELKVYVKQLTVLIGSYPVAICERLLDPRTGVPGMIEGFPFPSLASVRAMAEALVERRAEDLRREESLLEGEKERLLEMRLTPAERERRVAALKKVNEVIRETAHKKRAFPYAGPEAFGIRKEDHEAERIKALEFLAGMKGESQSWDKD